MEKKLELAGGYRISRIINGCWQLSEGHNLQGTLDFQDIMRCFHQMVDQGFTTFDCADIYTGAEDFIGRFVDELRGDSAASAQDIQIHTKYVPDLAMLGKIDFAYTEGIVDRSLQRLHREWQDMVQFHWWDYEVPGCLDVLQHLVRLKEKGKIRHISLCNFDTEHVKQVVDAGIPVLSNQSQYSFFDRRPEKGLLDCCRERGVALFCYGTLAGGFLSERWIGRRFEQAETRSQVKYLQVIEDSMGWEGYQRLLAVLQEIAQRHEVSIANVAVHYVLSRPGVGAAIVGVRNSRHAHSTPKALSFQLTQQDEQAISEVLKDAKMLPGEPFELERTVGSRYRSIMKMNINKEEN